MMSRNPFMLACVATCFAGIFLFCPQPRPPWSAAPQTYIAFNR